MQICPLSQHLSVLKEKIKGILFSVKWYRKDFGELTFEQRSDPSKIKNVRHFQIKVFTERSNKEMNRLMRSFLIYLRKRKTRTVSR